jgi:TolB-like protein/Flp pilus assembly protein TadD
MERVDDFPGTFQFGQFHLDVRSAELRKNGAPVKLQPQPLKVLALLVARAGQVVGRDEICRAVWGQETFVDFEHGLNYCIRQIRAALSDGGGGIRYLETCPRRGYRFVLPVMAVRPEPAISQGRVMLAVLPLENRSRLQDQEYLADGLTDEVITQLSRLSPKRLGVIARTSAMQYKRTCKGIEQIGRELGVEYLVDGAVRREGDWVRITAQLIQVSDRTHVWANSYQRQIQDVFLLQSELAAAIANEVLVKLVPEDERAPSGRRVNPEAYEACLKARSLWNRRTRNGLYRALEFFSESIQIDPEYAPAFAGLADVYLTLLDYRYLAPNEGLALSMAAATNALRLDEGLADAHTSLGHARLHALDWDGAEREFMRAIQLSSGYAPAHFYYANFLTGRRRWEEAIAEAREALKLDPVSIAAESNLAVLYYNAGRYDEALESCRKALVMEPVLPRPHDDLGRILLEMGAFPEAVAALEKSVSLSGREPRYLSSLGYAYGVTGKVDLARGLLAELTEKAEHHYVGASDFALVNAGLGERDQAFHWLERACRDRDSHFVFLQVDPRFASLHSDARFQGLLARAGLRTARDSGGSEECTLSKAEKG